MLHIGDLLVKRADVSAAFWDLSAWFSSVNKIELHRIPQFAKASSLTLNSQKSCLESTMTSYMYENQIRDLCLLLLTAAFHPDTGALRQPRCS